MPRSIHIGVDIEDACSHILAQKSLTYSIGFLPRRNLAVLTVFELHLHVLLVPALLAVEVSSAILKPIEILRDSQLTSI